MLPQQAKRVFKVLVAGSGGVTLHHCNAFIVDEALIAVAGKALVLEIVCSDHL